MSRQPIFESESSTQDLKRKSVRGAAASGLGQVGRFALRFLSVSVLAHQIHPSEHGLVAMTAVVTGFAQLFKDAGLSTATIQREEITEEQVSVLFWVNAALGLALASLLVAASPLVAAFYGEERLVGITCVLAIPFVLSGLSVQHVALMRRRLMFRQLAVLEIVSMAVGVAVAITLALAGAGYWALVAMPVSVSVADLVGAWTALRWRPGRPRRGTDVRQLLRFGGDVLVFDVVNYASRNADNVLLGWYWGSGVLAFYEKAYSLLMLPIGQVNRPLAAVAIPTLSRLRGEPARLGRFFLRSLELIGSVTLPIVVGIAVFADDLVGVFLGPEWGPSANLFRLLALAAAARATTNPVGWLLIALGQTRRYRNLAFVNTAVVLLAFALGLRYGAEGVAVAYSSAMALLFLPIWVYVLAESEVRIGEVLGALAPAAASCVPAALAGRACLYLELDPSWPWPAVVGGLLFALCYLLLLLGAFRKLAFFRGILKEFRR